MVEIEINKKDYYMIFNYNYNNFKLNYLNYDGLEYNEFFENFLHKNWPCVVKNVSLKWECTNYWLKDDKINYDYMIEHYGDLEAPVADCNEVTFNAHNKTNMKVSDYMHYLKNDKKKRLLYLKDWHLRKTKPNDCFYKVPHIFASDWLNEFALDHEEDDFMFVYIGPKDSWTPLHADVYSSYSWSVNVVGKKKWIIFPPGEEEKLKDQLGNLPLLFHNDHTDVKFYEVIQEKGDAIFVPSGWFHQVVNLLDTISINHNWINSCNIELVWNALQKNLSSVEHEIKEFKDTPEFSSQCQLILKSLFGMDFATFVKFLCYIGEKRLTQMKSNDKLLFNQFYLGKHHIEFDLYIILKLLDMIHNQFLDKCNCLPSEVRRHSPSIKTLISSLQKIVG